MSYIIHMSKGNDVELTDKEYQVFRECVVNGEVYDREVNDEMINPAFFINAEKVIDLPKAEIGALDRFMERRRAEKKNNPETIQYGTRNKNAS